MNCEQVKKLIPDWLDGETDAFQAKTIENHLFNCESCRKEAAFWKAVGTAFQENTGDIKAPEGFANAVMAQLPKQQNNGFKKLTDRWKRGIAAAAVFLLVAAGSATGYFQWINTATRTAEKNPTSHVITANPEPGVNHEVGPGPQNDPGDKDPSTQSGENDPENTSTQQSGNNKQENPDPDVTPGDQVDPFGGSNNGDNGGKEITNPGELALMNTDKDRVVERTFLQVKVEDFDADYARGLEYINGANAQHEVITSENTGTGTQETLKIVVDNSQAGMLLTNLKDLGQVVNTEKTQNDITAEYNEKVEQVSLLKGQFAASGDEQEREQLQLKITGIMADLNDWDRESKKKTIILWLEN